MKCEDFAGIVADLNREGVLHSLERTRALEHAGDCARCTQRLEEARGIEAALSDLVLETDAVGAPESVRQAILRELGARASGTAAASRPPRVTERRPLWAWATATAAALAVTALVSSVLLRNAPGSSRDVAAPTARTVASDAAVRTEGDGEFVPLQYGDLLADSDSFLIVRVRLDRSRLADLGLSVVTASDADTVPADLLLGQDGIARAIRLVE